MILPHDKYSLKPVWWFWLPWALAIVVAIANALLPTDKLIYLYEEQYGVLEYMQAIAALAGAGVALACLRLCKGDKFLIFWCATAFLSCLYIGLEEISYGQHFFKWGTPEFWAHFNDQNETNLHNTSQWLDQKPRQILTVGVIVGGIIIPLLQKYKPHLLPKRFEIIYPEAALFWPAMLVILSRIAKTLHKADIISIYQRASEVNEFYLYYFTLAYLVMLRIRLKKRQAV